MDIRYEMMLRKSVEIIANTQYLTSNIKSQPPKVQTAGPPTPTVNLSGKRIAR